MSREDLPAPDAQPELGIRPRWLRTGSVHFPAAAMVDGHEWVLRLNSFPDHPMSTLFVDGVRRFDIEGAPPSWGKPLGLQSWVRGPAGARRLLDGVRGFAVYGSEVGDPCTDPFCCGW